VVIRTAFNCGKIQGQNFLDLDFFLSQSKPNGGRTTSLIGLLIIAQPKCCCKP